MPGRMRGYVRDTMDPVPVYSVLYASFAVSRDIGRWCLRTRACGILRFRVKIDLCGNEFRWVLESGIRMLGGILWGGALGLFIAWWRGVWVGNFAIECM